MKFLKQISSSKFWLVEALTKLDPGWEGDNKRGAAQAHQQKAPAKPRTTGRRPKPQRKAQASAASTRASPPNHAPLTVGALSKALQARPASHPAARGGRGGPGATQDPLWGSWALWLPRASTPASILSIRRSAKLRLIGNTDAGTLARDTREDCCA